VDVEERDIMKVCFKQIKAGSGPQVWTRNVHSMLTELGIDSEVCFYPRFFEITPQLIGLFDDENDFDVVQSNTREGFVFKRRDTPLVVRATLNVHEREFDRYRTPLQRLIHPLWRKYEEKSLGIADEVVFVSEHTKKSYQETFNTDKGTVIYNGVDADFFKPMDVDKGKYSGKTIILFVGNLSKRKGADLLPRIMEKLGDEYILLCAGLREKPGYFGKNMKVLGKLNRDELRYYYNLADVFLFPSRLEGLSLSTLEAMACGLPIVATNTSSFPEIIEEGRGGFLCKIDDAVEFAEKTRLVVKSRSLGVEMGKYNREKIEKRFTIKKMANKYLHLYRGLV